MSAVDQLLRVALGLAVVVIPFVAGMVCRSVADRRRNALVDKLAKADHERAAALAKEALKAERDDAVDAAAICAKRGSCPDYVPAGEEPIAEARPPEYNPFLPDAKEQR